MGTIQRPATVAIAVGVGVLPYLGSLGYGFALDDTFAVTGHPGVHGSLSATDLLLRDFWGRSYVDTIGSWRPVATATYWLDWHLGGGHPWVFHATNVVLYAALLAVFERFLARFFGPAISERRRVVAVAVVGLLAIHADVVPSVAGRAEILAALFGLLAILLPLRRDEGLTSGDALLGAGATLLAMGSKESALPIALLAPLLVYRWRAHRGQTKDKGLFVLFAANALALAGVVAFRSLRMPWMAPGPERAAENPLLAATTDTRLAGAGAVLLHYLGHLAWPFALAPDYSYAATDVGHEPLLAALGIALAIGAAWTVVARWRRPPGIADAWLGFGASYVVVSHVFLPAIAVLADRLFFFPSLWLVTVGALALDAAFPAPVPLELPALALLAILQGCTAAWDATAWHDDVTLLTRAVEARPTVARSRRNLAQALAEAGRPEEAAWQEVTAMTILARYPAPFPPDEIRTLDAAPLDRRVAALGERIGACGLKSRLEEARAAFVRWGLPDPAKQVDMWLTGSMDEAPGHASCP
jgi:hypothetical protein